MLTNEMIEKLHKNAVDHGWWDDGKAPSLSEVCALIHCEISESMEAYRNGESDEYIADDGKPEGVWVELADVVIRCADALAAWQCEHDHFDDLIPKYMAIVPYGFGDFIASLHSRVSRLWDEGIFGAVDKLLSQVISWVYCYAQHNNIDLDGIIERKHQYNITRPYRHGGKRL